MPSHNKGSQLEAALSYYSSIVVTTSEGDSVVSDETLKGLGTTGFLLFSTLFGSLFRLAQTLVLDRAIFIPPTSLELPTLTSLLSAVLSLVLLSTPSPPSPPAWFTPTSVSNLSSTQPKSGHSFQPTSATSKQPGIMDGWTLLLGYMLAHAHSISQKPKEQQQLQQQQDPKFVDKSSSSNKEEQSPPLSVSLSPASSDPAYYEETAAETPKSGLTIVLPRSGYFVAGAVAGGVSRTATAPLDRLKVYLLVNTNTSANAVKSAAKNGKPLKAISSASRPIAEAIAGLYKAGGLRTFFAGRFFDGTPVWLSLSNLLDRKRSERGQNHARNGHQSTSLPESRVGWMVDGGRWKVDGIQLTLDSLARMKRRSEHWPG